MPANGGVLGQDRDAPLFFERVGVHHALFDDLIFAEGSSLTKHFVDESGLPVVDVRDNGDVANLHSLKR